MSLSIVWTPRGLHDFYRLHWRQAADVDAAVQEFARSGGGDLRLAPIDPTAPLCQFAGSWGQLKRFFAGSWGHPFAA